jgi:transcriptional antiterminator NusG
MVATAASVEIARWYAVWTRSHCEQLVRDQLLAQGHTVFLPKVVKWGRGARTRVRAERALFPGYLFVQGCMDKGTQAAILRSRGVVRILGERWDRLAAIPDEEVEAVQRMVSAGIPAFSHATPTDGETVRITGGPLAGLHGRFLRARPARGLFVVSVALLQRSVAAEVDSADVERV